MTDHSPRFQRPGRRRSDSRTLPAQLSAHRPPERRPGRCRALMALPMRATCLLVHSLFVVAASAALLLGLFLWLLIRVSKALARAGPGRVSIETEGSPAGNSAATALAPNAPHPIAQLACNADQPNP